VIKIIHGELWSEDFSQLNKLVEDFSSCMRFAFNRFQKDHNSFDEVRNLAKWKYNTLNARQVADAVMLAEQIFNRNGNKKVIFGSRKLWNYLKSGKIDKEEWNNHKNGQIYARGDKSRKGNQITRVVGEKLQITIGYHKFISYKLFIPQKFQTELQCLLASGQAYNVRLIKKDKTHYRVVIDCKTEDTKPYIGFADGAIGIDTNPDRIAVCEVSKNGNLVKSFSLVNNKLAFASENKREYEIALLVRKVIDYAMEVGKGVVFENLFFDKTFERGKRKTNRMKSNFIYRKFLSLLERKCQEYGIGYKQVNPAYTSVIGKLKYKDIYKINVHESAAFVIGRRGLGYNEKLSLRGYNHNEVKKLTLSTLRTHEGKDKVKGTGRIHSWRLWRCLKDRTKAVLTGLSSSMFGLKETNDLSQYDKLENVGETPTGEIFPQERIAGSRVKPYVGERPHSKQTRSG